MALTFSSSAARAGTTPPASADIARAIAKLSAAKQRREATARPRSHLKNPLTYCFTLAADKALQVVGWPAKLAVSAIVISGI